MMLVGLHTYLDLTLFVHYHCRFMVYNVLYQNILPSFRIFWIKIIHQKGISYLR